MPLPGRDEMVEIVDCFRLHMVMNMLGRSLMSNWSVRGVAKLLTMADLGPPSVRRRRGVPTMVKSSPSRTDPEESDLRRQVEGLLSGAQGRPVESLRLRREPSPFATLFPAEVVTGRAGREGRFPCSVDLAEQSDHPEKRCRDREVRRTTSSRCPGPAGRPLLRLAVERGHATASRSSWSTSAIGT